MKFWISFKEFASDPVRAILFLTTMAVGFLYVENRTVYQKMIQEQEKRITEIKEDNRLQKAEIDTLRETVYRLLVECE